MSSNFMPLSNQKVADGLEVVHDHAPALAYGVDDYPTSEELTPEQPVLELKQERERRQVRRVPVFWIVVAVVSFVLGGAVGGGVGAGVSLHEKSSSTSSPVKPQSSSPATATAILGTTTASTAPAATITITNTINNAGCPFSINNGSTYLSQTSTNYTIHCNTAVTPGLNIQTATSIHGSSIYSCLDACTSFNDNATNVAANGLCVAATWAIYYPVDVAAGLHTPLMAECFLKAGRGLVEQNVGAVGLCGVVQS